MSTTTLKPVDPHTLVSSRLWRLLLLSAVLLVGITAAIERTNPAYAAGRDAQDFVETYERDVYVIVGSTLRNPDETTSPDAPLFTDSGINLGLTWDEWREAAAQSTVHVAGGHNPMTQVVIELTGLVPNGVYSVFYGTLFPDSEHPDCQDVERTLPVSASGGSRGPDESSFVADANGNAKFSGRIEGDLLAPMQSYFSIVYHFDGGTYHPFPNKGEFLTHNGPECRSSFGQDAMRQLLILQKW